MSNKRSLKDIVELISTKTGLKKEEIHELINQKMDELREFVTELGAANIVAREQGVDITTEPVIKTQNILNIRDLAPDLTSVNLLGRILRIYDRHSFKKKDGSEGALQSILVEDKTGEVRVIFWDQKSIELSNSNCKTGDPIRIFNGYTKLGREGSVEVHLGIRSQFQVRPSGIEEEDLPEFQLKHQKIADITVGEIDISLRAKITQIDNQLEFERSDGTKGCKLGIVVGDETGEIYINIWNEKVEKFKDCKLGDIVEIIGLTAKAGRKGFVELHSTSYTNVSIIDIAEDITVKKGFIVHTSITNTDFVKISEISEANKLTSVKGLIIDINQIHEFPREQGPNGLVRNLTISDNTGVLRVVLWDNKAKLVDDNDVGKVLLIQNCKVHKNRFSTIEAHCGNQSLLDIIEVESKLQGEYTVNFSKISELSDEETIVNIQGVIVELGATQNIETKNGEQIQLRTFKIDDQTANIRVTCWRDNINKLSELRVGDLVSIYNAKIRKDTGYGLELTITKDSIIRKSSQGDVSQEFVSSLSISKLGKSRPPISDIEDIKEGDNAIIQATVTKLIEKPCVFQLCPICKKKMKRKEDVFICNEHGETSQPLNRILFTFTVNDGTGDIDVLCAGKIAEGVIGKSADDLARMVEEHDSPKVPFQYLKSKNFLNSELIIEGKAKKNQFSNRLEIIAKTIKKADYKDAIEGIVNQIFTD